MTSVTRSSDKGRPDKGVFQPSRAQIAREMKARLDLGFFDRRRNREKQSAE